jgi:hypothetical protein
MLPLIRPRDVVRVRPVTSVGIRTGDVVALRRVPGGGLLLHGVVGRRGEALVLRGDNNIGSDGEYAEGEILGVVGMVEREGQAVRFGRGRFGTLVALAVRFGLVRRLNRVALPIYRWAYGGRRGRRIREAASTAAAGARPRQQTPPER